MEYFFYALSTDVCESDSVRIFKEKKCMFLFKMKIYLLDIYLLTIKLDLIFLTYGDTHLDIIHTKHCHNCALTNY